MKRVVESSIPISQHVEAHREALLKRTEQELPALRAKRDALARARAACTTRRTLRRAADIGARVAALDAQIGRLEGKKGHLRTRDKARTAQ